MNLRQKVETIARDFRKGYFDEAESHALLRRLGIDGDVVSLVLDGAIAMTRNADAWDDEVDNLARESDPGEPRDYNDADGVQTMRDFQ